MRNVLHFLLNMGAIALFAGCSAIGTMPQPSAGAEAHSNSSSYKVLYSFSGPPDGRSPQAALIEVGGKLYGTTLSGGRHSLSYDVGGTVFSITTAGKEKVLHSFGAEYDGTWPYAGLINVGGMLYGTTYRGGSGSCPYGFSSAYFPCGTVFSITPSGKEEVAYNFGAGHDGNSPAAGLVAANGMLYGTTQFGGTQKNKCNEGCGIVFSLTPEGSEKVLHSFTGGSDGGVPVGTLIALNGKLYGATSQGGAYNGGTVFSITPSGKEKVLYSFASGAGPSAGVIAVNGTLYGTTGAGGSYSGGTVFSLTLNGTEKVLHSFGHGSDGANPVASLIDVKGTLYGTTQKGGAYSTCNDSTTGCGTVFSVSLSGSEKVLHSFTRNGTDGAIPVAALLEVNGTLYGTTSGGGTTGHGTVFALKP